MNNQPKKKFYKRWPFWTIIIILILLSLGSNEAGNTTNTTPNTPEVKADQPHVVAESITLGKSVITVNEVQFSQGGQYNKPTTGNEWINLNITIENKDSVQQYITTLGQMFVRDGAGNSYQVAVTDKSLENPNDRLDGAIIANSKRTGWVGFEIPKGSTRLQFQYNGSMWSKGNILVNLGR